LCCFILWIRDFINEFCKTIVFFLKKVEIFEIQNSPKLHRLLFLFYFFTIFYIFFFFYCTYPNMWKNYGIFCCVLLEWLPMITDFIKEFWKFLEVLKKIYRYMKYIFFQNSTGTIFFLFFLLFLTFSFLFHLSVLAKNFGNFYVLLFYGLEILSKNFRKLWNIFLQSINIWNPKFFINSIVYYLFFFLAFWTSFFPISPIQTCEKILNIFVALYYTDYRFYQTILENSWIFAKKNRDIWNTKRFQNSIV